MARYTAVETLSDVPSSLLVGQTIGEYARSRKSSIIQRSQCFRQQVVPSTRHSCYATSPLEPRRRWHLRHDLLLALGSADSLIEHRPQRVERIKPPLLKPLRSSFSTRLQVLYPTT